VDSRAVGVDSKGCGGGTRKYIPSLSVASLSPAVAYLVVLSSEKNTFSLVSKLVRKVQRWSLYQ
jgi:hypothetical protein